MSGPTVDVRDMLCAQALAVVASALKRVEVGEGVVVCCNAEDVARDLAAWAAAQSHTARARPASGAADPSETTLDIVRRR